MREQGREAASPRVRDIQSDLQAGSSCVLTPRAWSGTQGWPPRDPGVSRTQKSKPTCGRPKPLASALGGARRWWSWSALDQDTGIPGLMAQPQPSTEPQPPWLTTDRCIATPLCHPGLGTRRTEVKSHCPQLHEEAEIRVWIAGSCSCSKCLPCP